MTEKIKRRVPDAVQNQMTLDYRNGLSLRAIAVSHGHSYGATRNVLIDQGVTLRPRGGARKTGTTPRSKRTGQRKGSKPSTIAPAVTPPAALEAAVQAAGKRKG